MLVDEAVLIVLQVLYLFAPLLLAATLSGAVLRYDLAPALRRPIDGGLTFRGRRLFGHSKTWRGVVVAVIGGIAGVAIQQQVIGARAGSLALVDYQRIDAWALGAAMGAAAMIGELPNSFTKRQLGIAPGKTTRGPLRAVFYIWDQIDLLTVTWPVLACWIRVEVAQVVVSAALALLVHPLVSLIGFAVGARKTAR